MKIEIELDINKIDYDSINKQIAEKVAALDIKESFNIESKIDRCITDMITKHIDDAYKPYLDYKWSDTGYTDSKTGRELINEISKAEIEKRTKEVIDNIFNSTYNDNALRELVAKILPDVFSCILFDRLTSAMYSKEFDYRNMIRNEIKSDIHNMIHR